MPQDGLEKHVWTIYYYYQKKNLFTLCQNGQSNRISEQTTKQMRNNTWKKPKENCSLEHSIEESLGLSTNSLEGFYAR